MVSFPPCKINLGLNILRKRQDGYHDIDTCFYPIPFTDILEVIESDELTFSASGLVIPGDAANNLCLKAYHLLAKEHNLPPVKIHLHKIVPTGAGLGGGSSDGAHALRTINLLFDLRLTDTELAALAARLGSDCPFFIYDKPMTGKGRGEILAPATVSLKGYHLVLLNPGVHVSTADAFGGVVPRVPARPMDEILELPVPAWRGQLENDFEESIFRKYPVIGKLRDKLYSAGAVYSAMSGSGSSVFGIFDSPVASEGLHSQLIWQGSL